MELVSQKVQYAFYALLSFSLHPPLFLLRPHERFSRFDSLSAMHLGKTPDLVSYDKCCAKPRGFLPAFRLLSIGNNSNTLIAIWGNHAVTSSVDNLFSTNKTAR
jgi:hypothetical protein